MNYKRLAFISGLIALLILLLRGCVYAQRQGHAPTLLVQENNPEQQRMLRVYYADEKKVLELSQEEYLIGVVAAEMPASFHQQALCAQAVAARTYTLHRLERGGCGTSGCDICSDSGCCQAFDDDDACRKKWRGNYQANRAKITAAVEQTSGQALYYGGELIEALYHAASGGHTEDSENVFSAARPYLRGVESTQEVGSSHMEEEERFTRKDFAAKVNKAWPEAGLKAGKLEEQVEVEQRYESGRVKALRLGGVTVTGRELRSLLELRSAWFTITLTQDQVVVATKGYGHGVGMSQAGANGMAQQGAGYREILQHYYTGAEIRG